ncbi:MAG: hypothetical protein Q8941_00530 [Bacteroidota bacterium]|nr:hypothetical protein [Bacteroidota bacterium]
MGETLSKIRDLTIIIGIYLYFIAWVYVHFYYQQFGISTESVKIDYSTYLVYSYNVLISTKFLYWFIAIALLVLLRAICLWIIASLGQKKAFFKKAGVFLSGNLIIRYLKKMNQQYSLLLLIVVLVVIFPLLFKVAREVAIDRYREDRIHTENLKTIQFIFRKDADLMSPTVVLDSTLSPNDVFYSDISIIKNDPQQLLKLLGESDKYYIVLQQRPFNKILGALPSGYVYFIDKQDILLSKIILRSL